MRYFPKDELYALTSQVKRASVSIPSNIAEGRKRGTDAQFIHFLEIAMGSAAELETQLLIAKHLGFATDEKFITSEQLLNEVVRMLGKMISNLVKKLHAFMPGA